MTRLKAIKEARLLRGYLKLEQYVPKELMFVAAQGLKITVLLFSSMSSLILAVIYYVLGTMGWLCEGLYY